MILIKSLSGIRGTLHNHALKTLNLIDKTNVLNKNEFIGPQDTILEQKQLNSSLTYEVIKPIILSFVNNLTKSDGYLKIAIGADGRSSGVVIINWIMDILSIYPEIEIVQLGITTTPTLAFTVKDNNANGGIMVTASHNPQEWNGIKLFNCLGEGLSPEEWDIIYKKSEKIGDSASFTTTKKETETQKGLNYYKKLDIDKSYIKNHIKKILNLDIINVAAIKSKKWKIAVDGVNCGSGEALKTLLNCLGIKQIYSLNDEVGEKFGRGAEPIEQNLSKFSKFLKEKECFIGFATDPDGDRLSILDEEGDCWGEEYTLIACTDYVLTKKAGNVVSNLSSSRILELVQEHSNNSEPAFYGTKGYNCYYSPVGESNVVKEMKRVKAVIGGEGNGGIIYPELNYCRDALLATSIILSYVAEYDVEPSCIRYNYPSNYFIKKKINLTDALQSTSGYPNIDMSNILDEYLSKNSNDINNINKEDGVRIDFENLWIHARISNTEPIIRICGEGSTKEEVSAHLNQITDCVNSFQAKQYYDISKLH